MPRHRGSVQSFAAGRHNRPKGAPRAAKMLPDAWPIYEKYYPAHGQTEHNSVRDYPAIALLWALDSRDPMIDHHAYRHLAVSRCRKGSEWP